MRPLIALDADGVLLDLHHGYAVAWQRAFGASLVEVDPLGYWPMDRYGVPKLETADRDRLRAEFSKDDFWRELPAMPGALDACHRLHDAGHELVCVTALEERFQVARLDNLRRLGFPISKVVATGHSEGERSPKADAIQALMPVAFADDYVAYLRGLPADVHAALILRGPNGSPNVGPELALAHSTHEDLAAFAAHWLR
jgi:phosphoglycolate phosphatase-like HAD superfamily hydrolase